MSLFSTFGNTFWRQMVAHRFSWSVLSSFFKRRCGFTLLCSILLVSLTTVACSDITSNSTGSGGSTNVPPATPTPSALSSLHWCGKPAMVFRDQADPNAAKTATQTTLGPANGTPTTVNDWNTVKVNLGFTVFLPKALPTGSCLLNVSGSLRDPIFGSNFTITYVLPDQSSVSFSQAPSRSQSTSFQCNISDSPAANGNETTAKQSTPAASGTPGTPGTAGATPTATNNSVQLCNGVRDKTNIVFSARGTTAALEQFFQALQPDVDWVPAK